MTKSVTFKIIRTLLGVYSLSLTIYTLITNLNAGYSNPYLLLFIPLPVYFTIMIGKLLAQLYRHLDTEFVIDGYTNFPATFDLRFLFKQTSPSFLITICLFSTAISGTVIRAFLG